MSYSYAYLYDATGQPVGHVGVLAQMRGAGGWGSYPNRFDAAVFSPWPDGLVEGVRFAVRTESDDARELTRWRGVDEVLHFLAVGQPVHTNVAFVILKGPSRADLATGAHGLNRGLGISAHGIRRELATYAPTFKPLLRQKLAVTHLQSAGRSSEPAATVRRKVAAPAYTRTTGDARVVARSICRILHWD